MDTTTDTAPQLSEQNAREKIFNILNLSVPILMGIFIFFNPFPHTTSIKEICFYGSLIIVLILICFKKIDFSFKSPLTLPFALFTTWAFIGLFFALDKGNSLHDFRAHLLKYLVLYYILINSFNSKKYFEILSWIIIVSAGIFSIGGIIYFYELLGHPVSERMGFAGIAGINTVGFITVCAMTITLNYLIIEKKISNKVALSICLFATLIASFLTQTLGTLLGIIISFLVLFTKNRMPVIIFSLFAIIILIFCPVKDRASFNSILSKSQNFHRICIWHNYLQIINDNPIVGKGYGMQVYMNKELVHQYEQYKKSAPAKYKPSYFFTPHNIFIDVTVRLGFIGLALFLYIIFVAIYMCLKMIKDGQNKFIRKWTLCLLAVLVAYLAQGIFADFMSTWQLVILFTIFAMITTLWRMDIEVSAHVSI